MKMLSRRSLARYGADQLLAGVRLDELCQQLASVLVASKRKAQTQLLVADILRELEDRGVLARATVTSAYDLPVKLNHQISNYVKKAVKVNEVVVDTRVDSGLMGGVRIETANHIWDSTISKKIDDMRKVF